MDCGTGEPEISLCTRSGMCRWHRINAPIFIAVYHCLEGRTVKQTAWAVFSHQHVWCIVVDSSAWDTSLDRLSKTPDSMPNSDKLVGDDSAKSNSDVADASVHQPPSLTPEKHHSFFSESGETFMLWNFCLKVINDQLQSQALPQSMTELVSTIFSPLGHTCDTLFKHESRSDSTHTREMSHLAKTEAVDQYPCCADFLLCLLFNVQDLKCVSCIATGGKHSYSVGNIVVPRPEKERHNLELTGQY